MSIVDVVRALPWWFTLPFAGGALVANWWILFAHERTVTLVLAIAASVVFVTNVRLALKLRRAKRG